VDHDGLALPLSAVNNINSSINRGEYAVPDYHIIPLAPPEANSTSLDTGEDIRLETCSRCGWKCIDHLSGNFKTSGSSGAEDHL
jgi:hypothetical protein